MLIKQLKLGLMANFSYIVAEKEGGDCVLIDPSWDIKAILAAAEAASLSIKAAFLTHGHFDHSKRIDALLKTTPVYVEESDLSFLEADGKLFRTFRGDSVFSPAGFEIRALHTPGHSPGCVCYLVGGNLFTGDTLFAGAVGRVDLPGSDPRLMGESLRRLARLPPETAVYPGHAYGETDSSTIGEQLRENIYMQNAAR
ncbi:MAG: MBL fold metallo-hydrolase [Elusimicrobiales bacterium]